MSKTKEELNTVTGGTDLCAMQEVVMPDVIGKTYIDAKEKLSNMNLQVDSKYERSSSKEKDIVLVSDPLPGTKIPQMSKVVLTISSGK